MYKKFEQFERGLFYLAVTVVFLILSCSYFLPMLDLPQHAAQVQAFKAMMSGDHALPWLDNLEINWFTSYWIGYLSVLVFSFILPLNYATNLVVAISFVLFVLSFSALRKKFVVPNILDWVLIPSFFGFAYILGFMTYLLAIPLGAMLLIANLKLIENFNTKNILMILLLGVILYFSHMLIFLFFCQIAAGMTLFDQSNSFKEKLKRLTPFYFLVWLIPVFLLTPDYFNDNNLAQFFNKNAYSNFRYGYFEARFLDLFRYPWTIDTIPYQTPLMLFDSSLEIGLELIFIVVLLFPFLIGCQLTKDWKRYIPLLSFFIAWFCFPTQAAKTSFIYERFSIFFFPFYMLLFEKNKSDEENSVVFKLTLSGLWIVLFLWMTYIPMRDIFLFNKETNSFRELSSQLTEGKKVLSLIYDNKNKEGRKMSQYANFPVWYQALQNGWVEYNFAWFPPQIVRYKIDRVPENRPGFVWSPEQFVEFRHCDDYDYLIVRMETQKQIEQHQMLMEQSTCHHVLTDQIDHWYIYSLQ